MSISRPVLFLCAFQFLLISLTGCTSSRQIVYFQDANKLNNDTIALDPVPDHLVQPGDIVQVNVSSPNPEADQLFNAINQSLSATGNGQATPGILVDKSGEIDLPYIHRLKISNLSSDQARDTIEALLSNQLSHPTVNFRIANFQVSVIGDVVKPGTYAIPSERVNVLQAISLAGDLNITAKRNNVMIIREQDGKKIFTRLDLRSKDLVSSEFFYLRSNDMVYVEPSKAKISQNDNRTFQIATLGATILSLITIILIRANL